MTNYYVNPRELYYETIVSQALGSRTKKLDKMLMLINDGVNRKFTYFNEDDRYDCMAEGIGTLLMNWYLFDAEKSDNPFPYFTEISKRAHTNGLRQMYGQKGMYDDQAKIYSLTSITTL